MAAIVSMVIVSVAIALMCVIETYLIRVSLCCISHYFYCSSHLKQLYVNNKMEHFNYKDGCGVCGCLCIEAFKKELVWTIDKLLQVIRYLKQLYVTLRN